MSVLLAFTTLALWVGLVGLLGERFGRCPHCGHLVVSAGEEFHPAGCPSSFPEHIDHLKHLVQGGPTTSTSATTKPDRLLHLDLRPFDVLVDEGGQVGGVIDWVKATAGHLDPDRPGRAMVASALLVNAPAAASRARPLAQ